LLIASKSGLSVPMFHEYLECNGTQYIIMEFIKGKNLFSLTREKQLEQSQIINIGIELCEIFIRLHEDLAIVHRDGNLNNVILAEPLGRVVLLDFGNAITMHSEDEQVQLATDHFSAPEFRTGRHDSLRTLDIFAVGAILFSICFPPVYMKGSMYIPHPLKPFHEKELRYHLNILGVNQEFKEVILQAIKYNPAERHQDARQLKKDLELAYGTLLLSD
jgi:serine/threonine protein kinase